MLRILTLTACLSSIFLLQPITGHAQVQLDPCPVKRLYINSNYIGVSLNDSLPAQVDGDYTLYFFSETTLCETGGNWTPVFLTSNFSQYFPEVSTEEQFDAGLLNYGLIIDISGNPACPGITTQDIRQQVTAIAAYRGTPYTTLSFTFIDGEVQECSHDSTALAYAMKKPAIQDRRPASATWTTAYNTPIKHGEQQNLYIRNKRNTSACAASMLTQ